MSKRASTGDAPVPTAVIEAVAPRHAVDEATLADALDAVHADLLDGADAIIQHYRSDDAPPSIVAADGLAEVIFLAPPTWQVPTDLDDDDVRTAVMAAHAEFARRRGASEDVLADRDPLVLPSMELAELVRAGLSRRQAEVQVLRGAGHTQAAIGERLGMATNTVKVHCHRVDAKVQSAKLLVEHVDG